MRKIVKDFIMLTFVVLTIVPIMFITTDPTKNEVEFSARVQREQIEKEYQERQEEAEKIHTYYINVGGHSAAGCHDYTAYPSYSFNTETGEWSDGGNYVVTNGNELCEVNKYKERTTIGYILAVEYGDRLINNYCG